MKVFNKIVDLQNELFMCRKELEKAMNLHHSLTVQAESYKGQTAQMEKELVRLTAVLQQDELKINEWLTLQKETYAELEQLLSKDIPFGQVIYIHVQRQSVLQAIYQTAVHDAREPYGISFRRCDFPASCFSASIQLLSLESNCSNSAYVSF